jgi:hypothetical protein
MAQGPQRVGDVSGVTGTHAGLEEKARLPEEQVGAAKPHVVDPDEHRPDIRCLSRVEAKEGGLLANALQVLKDDSCISCHAHHRLTRGESANYVKRLQIT